MTTLRVGARGSDLSLSQTRWLLGRLEQANPGLKTELIVIETHGDREQSAALDKLWPPGGFVKDIERALLAGEIDMAVHSLKDVPTESVEGLTIAAMPKRAPAHDVMLLREPATLDSLPDGFVIGSSSPRRTHQILNRVPRVKVEPIRGNVPTRIRKLMEKKCDGVMLAAAGLERLGISHPHFIALNPREFPPAPGQGALAAQTREDGPARAIVARIDHAETRHCVDAERAFLSACGGGCHAAAGAYACIENGRMEIHAQLFIDGEAKSGSLTGTPEQGVELGRKLARTLLGSRSSLA